MSSLLDPSISPQRSLGQMANDVMDCPFTLEYVMQQMDSSLTEKIYEMLMEDESKPEMILPDTPPDLMSSSCQGDSVVKVEEEEASCSTLGRQMPESEDEMPSDYMYKDQLLPCIKQEPQVYYEHEYSSASSSWAHYPHRTYYGAGHYMY